VGLAALTPGFDEVNLDSWWSSSAERIHEDARIKLVPSVLLVCSFLPKGKTEQKTRLRVKMSTPAKLGAPT
jgi:hypothetical protein